MGVRVRPIQVGDSVRIKLRDGVKDSNAIYRRFDESCVYQVASLSQSFLGENMFNVAGGQFSFFEDEAIEIVCKNDSESDQFYDNSEALTDFISGFIKEDAQ